MAQTVTVADRLKSWWGPGYTKSWTPLGYAAYVSDADSVLKSKYNHQLQAIIKNRAPLSVAKYLDSYSVGVGLNGQDVEANGSVDPASANAVVTLDKGPHKLVSTFKFADPAKAYGSGSFLYSTELRSALGLSPLKETWLGSAVRLRASLFCQDFDMTKATATKKHNFNVGLDFVHGNVHHGHSLGAASGNRQDTELSLYHNVSVGSEGAAVGAELETSTNFTLRDYNLAAMYARPGAFTMTIGTKNRLKNLVLSETFNLGGGLRAATKVQTKTDSPLDFAAFESGLEYEVPKASTNTVIKAKVDSNSRASLAVVNNDFPWVNIGATASVNLDSGVRAAQGPSMGLALTFGDLNKLGADDVSSSLDSPIAGSTVCLPNGTCMRCPVRH